MNYRATGERLKDYRAKIAELRHEMRATQAAVEPEPVRDYVFTNPHGEVRRRSWLAVSNGELSGQYV
jgi:hypothetical protein